MIYFNSFNTSLQHCYWFNPYLTTWLTSADLIPHYSIDFDWIHTSPHDWLWQIWYLTKALILIESIPHYMIDFDRFDTSLKHWFWLNPYLTIWLTLADLIPQYSIDIDWIHTVTDRIWVCDLVFLLILTFWCNLMFSIFWGLFFESIYGILVHALTWWHFSVDISF